CRQLWGTNNPLPVCYRRKTRLCVPPNRKFVKLSHHRPKSVGRRRRLGDRQSSRPKSMTKTTSTTTADGRLLIPTIAARRHTLQMRKKLRDRPEQSRREATLKSEEA
ncbi:hypothetical protein M514_07313, partial [Trichuris suis]